MTRLESRGLPLYTFPHLSAAGAHNAIATRLGGVSLGPFSALNLGYSVGDNAGSVETNRQHFYAGAGVAAEAVVTCHQVHSTTVACVGDGAAGRGALAPADAIPASDALITDRPGLFLFLRFADCVPVLLFDPLHRTVGLAHAGWKGTVGNIVAATVAAMGKAYASRPEDMLAAIGPCVGPCHYAIKEDVAQPVRQALTFAADVLHNDGDTLTLDLPEANRRLLLAAGLRAESVVLSGVCTACRTDEFYSHRGEHGRTGRFGVLIGLDGDR